MYIMKSTRIKFNRSLKKLYNFKSMNNKMYNYLHVDIEIKYFTYQID